MNTSASRCLTVLLALTCALTSTSVRGNPAEALEEAKSLGILKGMVSAEMIRPDLLLVTVDGGLVPGSALVKDRTELGLTAAQLQKPEAFVVRAEGVEGFADGVKPVAVHRSTREWFNSKNPEEMWPLVSQGPLVQHDFYLKLPRPLVSGHDYTVEVDSDAIPSEATRSLKLAYDAEKTPTRAIKINQVGHAASAAQRFAYLGWWAGDGGTVDFGDMKTFRVIEDKSGRTVKEGEIKLRRKGHALSGEDVYEMDISDLGPGAYRIVVPGFASSDRFTVGGDPVFETFYQVARVFFHQRCGQELKEPWTAFPKPAAFSVMLESGHEPPGPNNLQEIGRKPVAITGEKGKAIHEEHWKPVVYTPYEGEKSKEMVGGYHDAADYDTFTYHLPATYQLVSVYELYPEAFNDAQLNIPESGNNIPDVLDEAVWALSWYADNQLPGGAVPLGRINLCDSRGQQIEGGKNAPMPPYGIIPPSMDSTPTFAAVAAQVSRVLRPHDAKEADRLLDAAKKAFAYAKDRSVEQIHAEHSTKEVPLVLERDANGKPKNQGLYEARLVLAAAELLRATKDPAYNEYIVQNKKAVNNWQDFELPLWAYTQADPALADPTLQAEFRDMLINDRNWGAEVKAERTFAGAYRMANGDQNWVGWGRAQGINQAPILIYAHALTGDQKFLDAVALNADWHSGANPIGQTFLTSMGVRPPNRPEIAFYLYGDRSNMELFGNAAMGFPIYGFGPPVSTYPANPEDKANNPWPLWRSWRDVWGNWAEIYSEFTIHQTVGPAAMTYAYLYAHDLKKGAVSPEAKPQHPLGNREPLNIRESGAPDG